MTRLEENRMVIEEMAKRAELKPTGTYEEMVAFQLGAIATMLADISKSLAILADKPQEIEMHPDCKECEWKDPSQAQCYDGHIQRIGCQNINRKQEKESKKQGEKRHEY